MKKILVYFFCALSFSGMAQAHKHTFRQRELGFLGGGSYYLGDLNPRKHFFMSSPACGIFFRYATNYRYAFRFGFNYGNIGGNDARSKEADQIERNLNFKSRLYELNTTAEFNFVEYRIGHDRHRFTMFVFAGVSGFYFNPKADIGKGYEEVRPMQTEGKHYPKFQVSIPFGLGLKWNAGKKCGIGIEWGPRRTFTDFLDDVSGVYPNFTDPDVKNYTNQSLNGGGEPGNMRGNPSTKDWYFYYGITLNIKLKDPNDECHGRNRKARSRRK
ncbi:MAG: hypothetical protein KF900_08440 [Bacteroidetes bacterium]|nr:hypothetical protein [Bacteroidota bacterium]